jgi:hypothetical protein
MFRSAPVVPLVVALGLVGAGGSEGAEEGIAPAEKAASATPGGKPPAPSGEHWAFQPLERPRPPIVSRAEWCESPVDAFILSRLEAADLRPVEPASRRVWLRRTTFALTGLPPSPDESAAFVADAAPDAEARLVDRLLASPQFGERWGRHWLDLARYADSNGLDENFLFREAWRYRNWVIDAVNADMPFDRFVLEQVAGDLLPHASIEERDRQRIATGFLVVGPKVLLGNDPRNQRLEVADEQLDTIGKALLGQSLGCARCHDHKFDPIPTADYYALAGILTSTEVMEQRFMLGEQRVMERLSGLGADGDERDGAYETYWRERPELVEREKQAKTALDLLAKGDAAALAALAEKHAGCVAAEAMDASRSPEARIEAQKALVERLSAAAAPPAIPPRAMAACDADSPADERVRLAGRFDRPDAVAPRGFLRALGEPAARIPAGASGRLELGRWLTDVESGAGRLAARVLANRVWHHLIGRGIVRTADNFGRTGEAPTHPELLDGLASELAASRWSMKHLVRRVVLSRSFRMGSGREEAASAVDPDNRLLWRAHRRRLDPESLRDAMLAAAGALDLSPMDSSVWYLGDQATAVGANKVRRRTDFPCRSVYLPVIRNDLPEIFAAFDFADPHATTGERPQTAVATQSLFLLNDESVMAAGDAIGRRVIALGTSAADRIDALFDLVLGAAAGEEERRELSAFIDEALGRIGDEDARAAELRAWSMAAHALLASSRFQILE